MAEFAALAELANKVLAEVGLGKKTFSPRRIDVRTDPIQTPEEALARLRAYVDAGAQGWVAWQSGIVVFAKGRARNVPEDLGLPLSAELARKHESLTLLPDGAGGWLATTVREVQEGGKPALADEVEQLCRDEGLGKLRYVRYWRQEEGAIGFAPVAVRFVGFSSEG